jgi:hypothetical protein
MLLFANKARTLLTGSVTSAAGQVAAVTTGSGALFVGVGGVATSTANPMRCVITAVDGSGNDTGAIEIVEITRSGDNLTLINRALEGTAAAAWGAGTVIECRATAAHADTTARQLFGGIGLTGLSPVTTPVTLFSSVLSIPAGFLVAGDRVRCEFFIVRRGTQHAQSITIDAKVNGTSVIGNFGTSSSADVVKILMDVVILSTTSQAVQFNDFFGSGSTGGAALLAINTGTTALTIDALAAFGSTATDTLGLEHYTVALLRAA